MKETAERDMVRELDSHADPGSAADKFTSLQPTYEDTIPPDPEHDWELDD